MEEDIEMEEEMNRENRERQLEEYERDRNQTHTSKETKPQQEGPIKSEKRKRQTYIPKNTLDKIAHWKIRECEENYTHPLCPACEGKKPVKNY